MKLKVLQIFPTERRFLELSSLKHHEVKNERVPHSIGVKLHFSAGSVIDELLAMGLLLITLPMLARSSPCLFFFRPNKMIPDLQDG